MLSIASRDCCELSTIRLGAVLFMLHTLILNAHYTYLIL